MRSKADALSSPVIDSTLRRVEPLLSVALIGQNASIFSMTVRSVEVEHPMLFRDVGTQSIMQMPRIAVSKLDAFRPQVKKIEVASSLAETRPQTNSFLVVVSC